MKTDRSLLKPRYSSPRWLPSCLLLLSAFAACTDKSDADDPYAFPKGFMFGVATAGFQSDMGCPTLPPSQCADPHSDWYRFVTSPAILASPTAYVTGGDPAV